MDVHSRRKFLVTAIGGIVAAAGALVAYPLFRYLAPAKKGAAAAKVTIAASDLPEGSARFFQFAGRSAVVVRLGDGRLSALSAVCTHLGCIVQWQKDKEQFLCPCHGGLYNSEGAVLAGPPPKPLEKLPVKLSDGNIVIG